MTRALQPTAAALGIFHLCGYSVVTGFGYVPRLTVGTLVELSRQAMTALPNHCCPVCGHPVGTKRWFWRAWIWARWNCESCGARLRFDLRRRLLFGLFVGLLVAGCGSFAALFVLFHVSLWIWALPLFAAYVIGFVFVVRHGDRIAVASADAAEMKC